MIDKNTQTEVSRMPKCDFCPYPARYDFRTPLGPWANACRDHFVAYGGELGLGKGQKLVLRKKSK
jgi:hypothetical protein